MESSSPASFMQWSVSIIVSTVDIAVSISDQQLHYVQMTMAVDVDGGYMGVSGV